MLDMNRIRDETAEVAAALARRDAGLTLDTVLDLDRRRREGLTEVEQLRQTRNERSKAIGQAMRSGGDSAAPAAVAALAALKDEVRQVGVRIAEVEAGLQQVEAALRDALLVLPNTPAPGVPDGAGAEDNPVLRSWGQAPTFDFEPQAHWDLGTSLGILDFERATKVAGARFAVLMGAGARLERALINFFLDLHTREHGYRETLPPFLVNAAALRGTGQLPKFEDDLFRVEPHGYYLVPTAEVPVTNLHADEILEPGTLPLAYCAYTPCFRSEAGSYGKDVRGLIRLHQFNKVEMVRFCAAEDSWSELEKLTGHAEECLRRLGLHYRVVSLCAGDLGFGSATTYDLEAWLPSQKLYREISSCSNFTDFQARRAMIRYRPEAGAKARLVHTLNGSGLAVGRTLVAILENYQRADGSVVVPEVLRPYMDGLACIEPAR